MASNPRLQVYLYMLPWTSKLFLKQEMLIQKILEQNTAFRRAEMFADNFTWTKGFRLFDFVKWDWETKVRRDCWPHCWKECCYFPKTLSSPREKGKSYDCNTAVFLLPTSFPFDSASRKASSISPVFPPTGFRNPQHCWTLALTSAQKFQSQETCWDSYTSLGTLGQEEQVNKGLPS